MDLTHIDCGAAGWAHFAAVIDCHDRDRLSLLLARFAPDDDCADLRAARAML